METKTYVIILCLFFVLWFIWRSDQNKFGGGFTCPVFGVVVISKDSQYLSLSAGNLSSVRHQIVWFTDWVLANLTGFVSTDGIEVAK